MDNYFFDGIDEKKIKKEREKARQLKKTGWWQRQLSKGECYYCHQIFLSKQLTMDHITPLARGGLSTKGNIVAACKNCNTKKRTMIPLEWEEYMASLEK